MFPPCYLPGAKHPTPVLLPGKSHGWRSWWAAVHGVAKSRTRLSKFIFTFHFHALEKEMATHSSVLDWRIPGTGESGWAAVYGVAQSWTQLKRLSSSSSSHCDCMTKYWAMKYKLKDSIKLLGSLLKRTRGQEKRKKGIKKEG